MPGVQVRYPPLPQKWAVLYHPKPVHLVSCSHDIVKGSILGAHMGSLMRHSLTAAEMMSDWSVPSTVCPVGVCLCFHANQGPAHHPCTAHRSAHEGECKAQSTGCDVTQRAAGQCSVAAAAPCLGSACCMQGAYCKHVAQRTSYNRGTPVALRNSAVAESSRRCVHSDGCGSCCGVQLGRQQSPDIEAKMRSQASPAAAAIMQACSLTMPGFGIQWKIMHIYLDNHLDSATGTDTGGCSLCNNDQRHQHGDKISNIHASPGTVEGSSPSQFLQERLSEVLLDDEWKALEEAHLILSDMPTEQRQLSRDVALAGACASARNEKVCLT